MILYLASPHTFLRFKEGFKLYESILAESREQRAEMKLFLAGGNGKNKIIPVVHGEDDMKVFLVGMTPFGEKRNIGGGFDKAIKSHKPYILESFYYADESTERLIPYFGDFLLDSGAFTFLQDSKSHLGWDEYIERYADFIKRNNVNKFFELDIDSIVGYEQVKKYRKKLEKLSGKRCIPVWHKSRGKKEFINLVKEYDYIGLGGIVTKEIKRSDYRFFPWFIDTAHDNDCKIHGLGFTNLKGLEVYKFDSVDSTAWTTGNRFGHVYKFNGRTMIKIDRPEGKRLADSRKIALINYIEWIKFQKYAEENL